MSTFSLDLKEKWNNLQCMLKQPRLHLTEYFYSVRNEIDYATEKWLGEMKSTPDAEDQVNSKRQRMIELLNKHEQSLLNELDRRLTDDVKVKSFEKYQAINESVTSLESSQLEMNELEDEYEHLALEMNSEGKILEKLMLSDQSFVFVPSRDNSASSLPGTLIHLDFHLSRAEEECLKDRYHGDNFSLEDVHLKTQNLVSKAHLAIFQQPLVLSRNLIWLTCLLNCLDEIAVTSDHNVIKLDTSFKSTNEQDLLVHEIFQGQLTTVLKGLDQSQIIGFESPDLLEILNLPVSELYLRRNRIESLDLTPGNLAAKLQSLNISENRITEYNRNFFQSLTALYNLRMKQAFIIGLDMGFDFLTNLKQLRSLQMTMPAVSFDFNLLGNLEHLVELDIETSAQRDANIARIKFNQIDFETLTSIVKLESLCLRGFDMELSQPNSSRDGALALIKNRPEKALRSVKLSNNCIRTLNESFLRKLTDYEFIDLDENRIKVLSIGAFDVTPNLKYLQLAHNLIEDLPASVFDSLKNLSLLNLDHNKLRHIAYGVFNRLENLRYLYLNENPIESIEMNAFKGYDKLEALSLCGCKLKRLESGSFNGLGLLTRIMLSRNQIGFFSLKLDSLPAPIASSQENLNSDEVALIRAHMFEGFTSLGNINLVNNNLEDLDLIWFSGISMLETLDLSNNRLRSFTNRHQLTMTVNDLRLSNNQLKGFEAEFFRSFIQLTRLDLQNNQLTLTVTGETFLPDTQMLELNLSRNKHVEIKADFGRFMTNMTKIHMDWTADQQFLLETHPAEMLEKLEILGPSQQVFERLMSATIFKASNLTHICFLNGSISTFDGIKLNECCHQIIEINFANNLLTCFDPKSFAGLDQLSSLDLSSNCISSLDKDSFSSLENLQFLNLSGNKLTNIHPQTFRGLEKLMALDLSKNCVEVVENSMFRDLHKLRNINLSSNRIKHVAIDKLFKRSQLIRSMNLSDNQLDDLSINEMSMRNLELQQALVVLNLASNQFEDIGFIRNLIKLEKLNLSKNRIKRIYDENGLNLFGRLMQLRRLDLADNQLEFISPNAFDHLFSSLKSVNLSNNPCEIFE